MNQNKFTQTAKVTELAGNETDVANGRPMGELANKQVGGVERPLQGLTEAQMGGNWKPGDPANASGRVPWIGPRLRR